MVNVFSIAIGGSQIIRYQALVVLIHKFQEKKILPEWKFYIVLEKKYGEPFQTLLTSKLFEKRVHTVILVTKAVPDEYSYERFRVHDDPSVDRWVVFDSHYKFDETKSFDAFNNIETLINKWEKSKTTFLASKQAGQTYNGGESFKRVWKGGFFGVCKSIYEEKFGIFILSLALDRYVKEAIKDKERLKKMGHLAELGNSSEHGSDEKFISYWIWSIVKQYPKEITTLSKYVEQNVYMTGLPYKTQLHYAKTDKFLQVKKLEKNFLEIVQKT